MAVDRSRPFLDATASVTDQALLNQVRQVIASGYLKDVQVLEQADKERTVYAKVRATINPQEVKAVIEREINRGQGKESPGLDQNRALKILSVREEADGTVAVDPAWTAAHIRTEEVPILGRVSIGTTVQIVDVVTGDPYTVSACGAPGSDWLKIDQVNGRTVQSVYGVPFVYSASGFYQ